MLRLRTDITLLVGVSLVACSGAGIQSDEDPAPAENVDLASTVGGSLSGLTSDQIAAFKAGQTSFATEEDVADGLGPVFNEKACGNCHDSGALGGGGVTVETRFGKNTDGTFDPLESEGGSLIQKFGIGETGSCDFTGEVVPPDANVVAGRLTTPIFGGGLVEAVSDSTLENLASRERSLFGSGTAGRTSHVKDFTGATRVGRFGWKAQLATLLDFSAGAYLNEMGITSTLQPNEVCPEGDCSLIAQCDPVADPEDVDGDVQKFDDFMRFLAPPPRNISLQNVLSQASLYVTTGCVNCHTVVMTTGSSSVSALNKKTFTPFSDFLLHDMGPLGDGIAQDDANANEIRTAPLWGARFRTRYLHDGRASSLNDAILAHDGQGKSARDKYAALSQSRKDQLIALLNSI